MEYHLTLLENAFYLQSGQKKYSSSNSANNNSNNTAATSKDVILGTPEQEAELAKAKQTVIDLKAKKASKEEINAAVAVLLDIKAKLPSGHKDYPAPKGALPPAVAAVASAATPIKTPSNNVNNAISVQSSEEEKEVLGTPEQEAALANAKKVVVDLKANKAPKEEIDLAVSKLLEVKKSLPLGHKDHPDTKKKLATNTTTTTAPAKNAAEELQKLKEARRNKQLREHAEKAEASRNATGAIDILNVLTDNYGVLPLVQSRPSDRKGKVYTDISSLNVNLANTRIRIRGYLFTSRVKKAAFLVIRQGVHTVQAVLSPDNTLVDEGILNFAKKIMKESVIDVEGILVPAQIKSTSQNDVEIQADKLFVVSMARVPPIAVEDCARAPGSVNEKGETFVEVNPDLRLDYRHLDMRTPVSQSIMRISSGVCQLFREFLTSRKFVEIQTPKLLGGSSEGGADVFSTNYFGQVACLAQSPQLHKQISAACAGFERVFEIGPVFRAENSNTQRHLCEFHGLDIEMAFNEHYHEILDLFSDLFIFMFDGLNERYKTEIEVVRSQYPFQDIVYDKKKTPVVSFKQGIQWLREAGVTEEEQGSMDDLRTIWEKKLGSIVKEKLGVDFYFLDQYPLSARPFYTMPSAEDPLLSNSYDFMLRNQEIMSGAQRIHDPKLLEEKIALKGINTDSLRFYIDAFKDGALPHGGGGIGLERVVMLFLGLPNIRMATLFTRDPQRLTP